MTLIVGYSSNDYAILASDRMITWEQPNKVKRYAPNQLTKSTLIYGIALMGYAGEAGLGGPISPSVAGGHSTYRDTSEWILEALNDIVTSGAENVQKWAPLFHAAVAARLTELGLIGRPMSLLFVGFSDLVRDAGSNSVIRALPHLWVYSSPPEASETAQQAGGLGEFGLSFPSVSVSRGEFRLWAVGNRDLADLGRAGQDIVRYLRRPGNEKAALGIAQRLARVIYDRSLATRGQGVGPIVQVAIMPVSAAGQTYADVQFTWMTPSSDATSCYQFGPRIKGGPPPLLNAINIAFPDGGSMLAGAVRAGYEYIGPPAPFESP